MAINELLSSKEPFVLEVVVSPDESTL
jgi:hypothetical protein